MPPTPPPVTADHFPSACPACHRHAIRPETQHNNFARPAGAGPVAVGVGHVSTTRTYRCDDCGHGWAETVRHMTDALPALANPPAPDTP